jgi:hypothetical protein
MTIERRALEMCSLFLISALVNTAHAGLIITDDTLYLQRAQMYPYVGWYTDLNSTTGEIGRASGVLVHPNFVLASAHQAFDSGSAGAPWSSNFRFGFGSNSLTDPGESQLVSEVFIHPTYGGDSEVLGMTLLYITLKTLSQR